MHEVWSKLRVVVASLPEEARPGLSVCWRNRPMVFVDDSLTLPERAEFVSAEVAHIVAGGALPNLLELLGV